MNILYGYNSIPAVLRRSRLRDHLLQVASLVNTFFSLNLVKAATEPSTSATAIKRDQGSREVANNVSAKQPPVIHRHEIINKAFIDDERTAQDFMAQNESSKAFILKPFEVVELFNDQSNIKVRLIV